MGRAPDRSRAAPAVDPPPPQRAPLSGRRDPAAAHPAPPGSACRGNTRQSSRRPGRLRLAGGAAWPQAAPRPRAPAAGQPRRPSSPPCAAGSTARPRHRSQRPRLRLGCRPFFSCHWKVDVIGIRLGMLFANRFEFDMIFCSTFFHAFSSKKKKHHKTSIRLRRRHGCSLVALDVNIEVAF